MTLPTTYCFCGWVGPESEYDKHTKGAHEGNVAASTLTPEPEDREPMRQPRVEPKAGDKD